MTYGNDTINGQTVTDANGIYVGQVGGLTKREYFAAMAMQGMLAGQTIDNDTEWNKPALGVDAVEFADALIDALNKESK